MILGPNKTALLAAFALAFVIVVIPFNALASFYPFSYSSGAIAPSLVYIQTIPASVHVEVPSR